MCGEGKASYRVAKKLWGIKDKIKTWAKEVRMGENASTQQLWQDLEDLGRLEGAGGLSKVD